MKHVIIGDLHGKDCWKEVDPNQYDKVIFLGDYVDHWTLPDKVIYNNLREIIELKLAIPDKVELLLGNHDVQYLHFPHYLCSGYRPSMQHLLTQLFKEYGDLFSVAYQKDNYLISHAGVTNKWYRQFNALSFIDKIRDETDTVADILNKVELTSHRWILHQAGASRGGEGAGGVTWADRKELIEDMLDGYYQIVGHTVISDVECVEQEGKGALFIDVLDTFTYFHELDI